MKKTGKLIVAAILAVGFSFPAFAIEEDLSLEEGLDQLETEELAMSKKSSAESAEYDYRGNPVDGKTKRKKGSYPSPITRKNTSSNEENSTDEENTAY